MNDGAVGHEFNVSHIYASICLSGDTRNTGLCIEELVKLL